ncbi:hypothetical protein BCM0079_0489 [Bacillus cereus]|nr:hypothetical protein BCM0045_0489 [Bacillus cereus]BCB98403.1 hypothetical protein BCM0057_0486 [Bacillus cereus]BCC21896.1 hypothetical protein BCM0079_0489 [Bacillus cereus]BCC33507.1 hypothetical protein BCM0105_0497 [Bacillus cereus]
MIIITSRYTIILTNKKSPKLFQVNIYKDTSKQRNELCLKRSFSEQSLLLSFLDQKLMNLLHSEIIQSKF